MSNPSNSNTPGVETGATPVKIVSSKGNGGVQIGYTSTEYLGFLGTAPVAQQSVGATVDTTVAVSTTSAIWGFASSTQANACIAAIAALQAAVKTSGLCKA